MRSFTNNARLRSRLIMALVVAVVTVPLLLAMLSPLQSSRAVPYVIGGLAGVFGYSLLFLQPLLVAGVPGWGRSARYRLWHRWVGGLLITAIALHIIGLYLASPPDMLDALLLVSPTPFSLYGVIALWCLILIALTALLRWRFRAFRRGWQRLHLSLGLVLALSSVVHALMIDGAMQTISKQLVAGLILAALVLVLPRYRQR